MDWLYSFPLSPVSFLFLDQAVLKRRYSKKRSNIYLVRSLRWLKKPSTAQLKQAVYSLWSQKSQSGRAPQQSRILQEEGAIAKEGKGRQISKQTVYNTVREQHSWDEFRVSKQNMEEYRSCAAMHTYGACLLFLPWLARVSMHTKNTSRKHACVLTHIHAYILSMPAYIYTSIVVCVYKLIRKQTT